MTTARAIRTPEAATVVVDPVVGQGDCTTIEEAFALLPAAGGTIYLKRGSYTVNNTLNVYGVVRILGESTMNQTWGGPGGTQILANVANVFNYASAASSLLLDGVVLGISISGVNWFVNSTGSTCYLFLYNCNVRSSGVGGRILGGSGAGIFLWAVDSTLATDTNANICTLSGHWVFAHGCEFTGALGTPGSAGAAVWLSACRCSSLAAVFIGGQVTGTNLSQTEILGSGSMLISSCTFNSTLTIKNSQHVTVCNCFCNGIVLDGSQYCCISNIAFNFGFITETGASDYNVISGVSRKSAGGVVTITLIGANSSVSDRFVAAVPSATVLDRLYDTVLTASGTLTLPIASTFKHQTLTIKKSASGAVLTVNAQPGQTIDGAASYVLSSQYDAATLICDGTAWHVLSEKKAGVHLATATGVATTNAYVEAFTHQNPSGIGHSTGVITNTDAVNGLTVQETFIDAWGVTGTVVTAIPALGSYALIPDNNIPVANNYPLTSYKVEVKSTVPGSHATYNLRQSTSNAL